MTLRVTGERQQIVAPDEEEHRGNDDNKADQGINNKANRGKNNDKNKAEVEDASSLRR
jgi:hypothetical protein